MARSYRKATRHCNTLPNSGASEIRKGCVTAVLQMLASVANGLSKAELRILLELAARSDKSATPRTSISSRELAASTGLARSSVQIAIDSLNTRQLVQSETGDPASSAVHRLICLDGTKELIGDLTTRPVVDRNSGQGGLKSEPVVDRNSGQGGLKSGPVVDRNSGQGGLKSGPVVDRNLGQGGLKSEPVVDRNSGQSGLKSGPAYNEQSSTYRDADIERTRACADSIDSVFDKIIDRLQKAQQSDFDELIFQQARQQIASHHAKFSREENRQPNLPDGKITAQFLAVADWPNLEAMLFDLASERKEAGHSYGWYVTVALQRIHGISPDQLRAIRTRLKNSSGKGEPVSERRQSASPTEPRLDQTPYRKANNSQPPNLRKSPEVERLQQQIRAFAAGRSM